MRKNVIAIIQARMGSTRFPGKVLHDLCGKPVLQWVIERVKMAKRVDSVIVATSLSTKNYPIVKFCTENLKTFVFRGAENDVLGRVYLAATVLGATHIVDITADCPLVDPYQIDLIVKKLLRGKYDYVSNCTYRDWPDGFDIQAITYQALQQLFFLVPGTDPCRSHVSWNLLHPPFQKMVELSIGRNIKYLHHPHAGIYHHPSWGLTVDTEKDLEMLNRLCAILPKGKRKVMDIVSFLEKNQYLLEINKDVERHIPGEG